LDFFLVFSWRLIRDNYVKQADGVVQQISSYARMYRLGSCPLARPSICRGLPPNCHRFSAARIFCTAKRSARQSFLTHDQALAAAIPCAHDAARKFCFAGMQPA
jgi:hypothetical protein